MSKMTESNEKHTVRFGGDTISFELEFRPRQRLSISVNPDRSVTVLAPKGREIGEVLTYIQKRAAWIARQRAYFEQFHPLPKEKRFVSGETHLYLGRQYRLKLHKSEEESVKLIGKYIHVYTPDREDSEIIKRFLDDWYKEHSKGIFETRLHQCLRAAPSLRLQPPTVIIRRMPRRWGSCTKARNLILNLDLVKTPLYCIEYVIMHELCHLRIHNHSQSFFRLIGRCMPDWEKRKARLDLFVL